MPDHPDLSLPIFDAVYPLIVANFTKNYPALTVVSHSIQKNFFLPDKIAKITLATGCGRAMSSPIVNTFQSNSNSIARSSVQAVHFDE